MRHVLLLAWTVALATACGAEGEDPTVPVRDSATTPDSTRPIDSAPRDTEDEDVTFIDTTVTDSSTTTAPPPIEDTSSVEDYGAPAPGTHVEKLIDGSGGTLAGGEGTLLAGVKLVVPPGALTSPVLLALDLLGPTSGPGTIVSPFVRVGPEGVAFAVPARLTVPWSTTVADPQVAMLARTGFDWSALLDPSIAGASITASMPRTSAAAAVVIGLSSAPTITKVAPPGAGAGVTLFLEGSGFGLAQVVLAGDGGVVTSRVTFGAAIAETLAWSDTTIAVRVPAAGGGVATVTTPRGSASR